MLTPRAENLWTSEQPQTYLGLQVGARMSVIRFPDGNLFIHSPLRPTTELRAEIDALGKVKYLVAPNRFHHLYIGDWMTAYPDAQSFAARGLSAKRKDLVFHETLDSSTPRAWSDQIDQVLWKGVPMLSEVVFVHRATRTLVLTDTVHNLGEGTSGGTKFVFGLLGGGVGFRTTMVDHLIVRDRDAAQATVRRVLSLDFDRVIMSHGEVLETGGKSALENAYRWLLA